jgi:gamma-glutamyltranspeptidase
MISFRAGSQPPSSDAFCLFYDAQTKAVKALNGSGHSPAKLTLDYVRRRGINGGQIPLTDLNSVTVPGMISFFLSSFHASKT